MSGEKVHVMPVGDLLEHMADCSCPCIPTPDKDEPRVIIHHAWDRRELRERCGTLVEEDYEENLLQHGIIR